MSTQTVGVGHVVTVGLSRSTDPDTSKQAARSVRVNPAEEAVFNAIKASGNRGVIAAEFPALTGLALNTASPRTRPLADKGLIFDSGERRTSPSGRKQIVWKAINTN